MGLCMKTTVELDDALFRRAKEACVREETSLKALIDEALRHLLDRRMRHRNGGTSRVGLPISSMRGGLRPGVDLNDMDRLEDLMNS